MPSIAMRSTGRMPSSGQRRSRPRPQQWAEHFGSWRLPDLRAILLHVIVETACHAGHLDAARELIDGNTWLILE